MDPVAQYGDKSDPGSHRRFPIDPGFLPEFLTTDITTPGVIWRLGQDYDVSDGWITFYSDPLALNIRRVAKNSEGGELFFEFLLWGLQVTEDIDAVTQFFGTMAGVVVDSTAIAKDTMNVAWDFRVEGATQRNICRALSLLTSTDYVDRAGRVGDVYTEGDRICVRTDSGLYTAPHSASALVNTGEYVEANQTIFNTFSIKEGNEEIDFRDFEGLAVGENHAPGFPGGLLFVNELVPVTRIHAPNWRAVLSEEGSWLLIDGSDTVVGSVDTEQAARDIIDTIPPDLYTFYVGGQLATVNQFLLKLNGVLGTGNSFMDNLISRYGRVPNTINPFDEIRDAYFKHSSVFIKIRQDVLDGRQTAQLLSVLNRTMPAGSGFFVIVEPPEFEEGLDIGASGGEDVTLFYVPEDPESGHSGFNETVLPAPLLV